MPCIRHVAIRLWIIATQCAPSSLQQKSQARLPIGIGRKPRLLIIDELDYLSYSTRYADLLFELVSRRYEKNSIIITTNRPFSEWGELFPSAACVVSLIDRLLHNAEVLAIDGESYRYKEAQERRNTREAERKSSRKKAKADS